MGWWGGGVRGAGAPAGVDRRGAAAALVDVEQGTL
jgi:hypothetical protein